MTSEACYSCTDFSVVSDSHTTFTCGDDFYWMKAEYSDLTVFAIANLLILVFSTDRVRSIFNNTKTVFF